MPAPPASLACPPQAIALLPAAWAAAKLLALHAPVIFFALAAGRALYRGRLPACLAAMVIYFLALAAPPWVSPGLSFPWLLAWAAAYGAAGIVLSLWEARNKDAGAAGPGRSGAASDPIALGGVITIALLLAALLVTAVFFPRFDHDPLTYQLYFAAAWLRDGHVSIVPTPFGDPSQAYGPALASMYYLWLMAPLGNDMLAQTGEWPFLLLTVLAAAGLARELGARPRRAFLAAFFIFMSPLALYEGRSALSDLAVASFFASSLYFLVRAGQKRKPADLALGLMAAGLMAGCKFTAAPLLVLLLPPLLFAGFRVRGPRAWAAWLAGIAGGMAGGGIWYARNWLIAGTPFFPIRISILGHEIFPGLYGREEMLRWVFHQHGWRAWGQTISANVSPLMLAAAAPALVYLAAGAAAAARKKAGKTNGNPAPDRPFAAAMIYLALLPLLIDRANWDLMPFQVDRFWLPALPVLAAALAVLCSRYRAAALAALALSYAGLLLFPVPEFLASGTRTWMAAALPACAASGFGLAWLTARRRAPGADRKPSPGPAPSPRRHPLALPLAAAGLIFALTTAGLSSYKSRREAVLSQMKYGTGWVALPCLSPGAAIAYTGSNMPYPLLGPHLQNRMIYVSAAGQVMPLDHELFRDLRGKPPDFRTPEPMLSSLTLNPAKWARAITASGADYLFIMRLSRNALINTAHDHDGWPLEDSWARAAPRTFLPFYREEFVRIYRVDRSVPVSLPDSNSTRPADGFAACAGAQNPDCQKFFPLAPITIRSLQTYP